ncbi:NAD(P)/FAD-dependent oxidoreductase [Sediminibacillus massiliensis]|uniref:NAD(P)/FAD-dependent oxidoreductase n=1 Tax=Sediminibacillus massiliensis TaxID=1926277 RepID=UPI0009883922|nr:NAD(P)/FAD-dependent oxidoreductase [Sediminibacillus massiliensis]
MLLDCIIVGGGPAGLNASLVLGRARKNIILFDEDKPRNGVTHESHGFITRDGTTPSEFKRIGKQELAKYPTIAIKNEKVEDVKKENDSFLIHTEGGDVYRSKKIILATGLKDVLPNIKGIEEFYGKSLFSCPFCDGWEWKDQALAVITENERAFHLAKLVSNWSRNLVICTNGKKVLSNEEKEVLNNKQITIMEDRIAALQGNNGQLEKILFNNGKELLRNGGFVTADLVQATSLPEKLGCRFNAIGGIDTDDFGRTNIEGVYACGDNSLIAPAQLIIAASEGSRAAIGMMSEFVEEDF